MEITDILKFFIDDECLKTGIQGHSNLDSSDISTSSVSLSLSVTSHRNLTSLSNGVSGTGAVFDVFINAGSITGTTQNSSISGGTTITMSSNVSGISTGMLVTGTGIPTGSTISSITGGEGVTEIVISNTITTIPASTTISFGANYSVRCVIAGQGYMIDEVITIIKEDGTSSGITYTVNSSDLCYQIDGLEISSASTSGDRIMLLNMVLNYYLQG